MRCEICDKEISRCDNCGTELVKEGYICITNASTYSVYHFHSKRCAKEWFGDSEPTYH